MFLRMLAIRLICHRDCSPEKPVVYENQQLTEGYSSSSAVKILLFLETAKRSRSFTAPLDELRLALLSLSMLLFIPKNSNGAMVCSYKLNVYDERDDEIYA